MDKSNQSSLSLTADSGLLFAYFTQVKEQIIAAAIQKGISATGKTLASLEIVATQTGYELQAGAGIYFMEHGRGPTTPNAAKGNPDLVQIIQEWLDAKGLNINPYAIANAIHKNGTKLFRAGGNSGVLSIPLNPGALNQVFSQLTDTYLQNAASQIFKPFNTLT